MINLPGSQLCVISENRPGVPCFRKQLLRGHWFCGTHKLPKARVDAVVQKGRGGQAGKTVFVSISAS